MFQWKCEKQCESAAPLGLNLISLLWFSRCTQVSVNTQVSFCALAFRRNPSDILGHWKWTVWNKGWRCSETPLSVFTSGQAEADIFGNDDTDTHVSFWKMWTRSVCVCVCYDIVEYLSVYTDGLIVCMMKTQTDIDNTAHKISFWLYPL